MKKILKLILCVLLVIPSVVSAQTFQTVPWKYSSSTDYIYPYPLPTADVKIGIGTSSAITMPAQGTASLSIYGDRPNIMMRDPVEGSTFLLDNQGGTEFNFVAYNSANQAAGSWVINLNGELEYSSWDRNGGGEQRHVWYLQNSEVGRFDDTGNFGLGSTSPYAKLSVAGQGVFDRDVRADFYTATSTTATSTFAYDVAVTGRLKVLQSGTNAVIMGDTSGNVRGSGALDIQSGRNTGAAVASGINSVAVGTRNTVAGGQASAFGFGNTCVGDNTLCMGYINEATGIVNAAIGTDNMSTGSEGASAIGVTNTASAQFSSAVGYGNTAAGDDYPSAFGNSNMVTASHGNAFGEANVVSNEFGLGFGSSNNVSSVFGGAFGYANNVSGLNALAFGSNIINAIADSLQIGPSNTAKATILSSGNFGIGTTTPPSKLTVQGTAGSSLTGVLTLASSTNATVFNVNGAGHIATGGGTPAVTSCGVTPSISGNDTSGTVTVGSGVVTACTITFAKTRSNTPRVVGVVTGGALNITGGYSAKSTTAVTFSFAATVGSGTFDYLIIE